MDLSGGRLELDFDLIPVVSGWVNAVHVGRNEARGHFSVATKEQLSARADLPVLVADGTRFRVVLLQSSPSEIEGLRKWRFVATCDARTAEPKLRPNPSLSRTQEFFLSAELQAEIEREDARLRERGPSRPGALGAG